MRRRHADFARATPISGDLTIDSTHLSISEVAARIRSVFEELESPRASGDRALFRDVDCVQIAVMSADAAARQFAAAGGTVLVAPFEIAIGRCAIVQDR